MRCEHRDTLGKCTHSGRPSSLQYCNEIRNRDECPLEDDSEGYRQKLVGLKCKKCGEMTEVTREDIAPKELRACKYKDSWDKECYLKHYGDVEPKYCECPHCGFPTTETAYWFICVIECVICGEQVEAEGFHQKYCSPNCREEVARERRRKRREDKRQEKEPVNICPVCGNEFDKTHHLQKYCSKECRKKYARYKRSKQGVIDDIREMYRKIRKVNPGKAQHIADEMRLTEDEEFTELVLDGLPPSKDIEENNDLPASSRGEK